jgi:hypothetical protein
MPLSMKIHVHWMNLMKNQIKQKFQNLEILKEMATRQMTHFLNHLIKKLCSMGSNVCLKIQVTCARNNFSKKHVWLSIETHFGIFAFLALYQNVHTQLCMNMKNHH